MFGWLSSKTKAAGSIVNKVFDAAVKETGAVVDSDSANAIKAKTAELVGIAKKITTNIADVNGDGKIDKEDIKAAAEKAGIAWDKLDPEFKTALLAGGVAGIATNAIPLIGTALMLPTFAVTTAFFYVKAKLNKLSRQA